MRKVDLKRLNLINCYSGEEKRLPKRSIPTGDNFIYVKDSTLRFFCVVRVGLLPRTGTGIDCRLHIKGSYQICEYKFKCLEMEFVIEMSSLLSLEGPTHCPNQPWWQRQLVAQASHFMFSRVVGGKKINRD